MPLRLEICVEGLANALAAGLGGAARIELCENLAVGGVTPSAGTIAESVARLTIPVQVLIRPRGGDFIYDEAERAAIRHDVREARRLGAAGVVVGALTTSGDVDRGFVAELVALARPLSVTFHKAFDEAADLESTLEDLIGLGIDRVLTSGARATAIEGLPTLAGLVRRSAGRIVILAGGRVSAADFDALAGVGIREVHIGSAATRAGRIDAEAVRGLVAAAPAS